MSSSIHADSAAGQTPGAALGDGLGDQGRLLALVMSSNALFSAASGLVLAVGAPWLAPWVQLDTLLLAVIGALLLEFAITLIWLMAQPGGRLRSGAKFIVAADFGWVGGAVALILLFPTALPLHGDTVLGLLSAVVMVLAVGQWLGLRRMGPSAPGVVPVTVEESRIIAAPADWVWSAISAAGDYADFVEGLTHTEIVNGSEEGMQRACVDDHGNSWSEACTLWEDGHRYAMSVDVSTYPWLLRMLFHEFSQRWTVEEAVGGTRVTLRFDVEVRLGFIGLAVIAAMTRRDPVSSILDAYEEHLVAGNAAPTQPN